MRVLWAAVLFIAPMSAFADETYVCKFADQHDRDWISPNYEIDFTVSGTDATVSEVYRSHDHRKQFDGKKVRASDRAVAFRWQWEKVGSGRHTATLIYNLVIQRKSGKATATAQPKGFANMFTANGRCALRG